LGNKKFVLKSECDNCNEFFGKNLENNLSNYLGICRTVLILNGKNGIPEFKTKDKKERVKVIKNQELQSLIVIKQEKESFLQLDEQNKTLTFNTEREPYIPISVYKCLVKIALSLLPASELKYFNQTIKWIRNKSNIDLVYYDKMINYTFLIERFVSSNKFINLRARGYIRRNDKFKGAYFYFILEFLNMSFQISVPCLDKDINFNINKNPIIIPSSYELEGIKYTNIIVDIQDMRKIYKINSQQLLLSIGYSELEKNIKVNDKISNLGNNLKKKIKKDLKINS
jgi:transcriptional regulator, abrB family protein